MNESNRPKYCPFCGSRESRFTYMGSLVFIVCTHCGAAGPYKDTPREAFDAWNYRA